MIQITLRSLLRPLWRPAKSPAPGEATGGSTPGPSVASLDFSQARNSGYAVGTFSIGIGVN